MEVYGVPLVNILVVVLSVFTVANLVANIVLARKLKSAKRNCEWATGLISRLAEDDNWGEITVMSSRSEGAQVYKTWIGDEDPQDLARRASQ